MPIVDLVELVGGVGVGVDDDLAAVLFGEAEVEVVEVGAGGAALCSTATPRWAAR